MKLQLAVGKVSLAYLNLVQRLETGETANLVVTKDDKSAY